MARVWYCASCGYEISSKGRCFNCGEKLSASALPALEVRDEEDEVGYRLDGWDNADRGRLIVALNDLGVLHRFEEEELVVDAADEARVDDLVTSLADGIRLDDADDDDRGGDDQGDGAGEDDDELEERPLLSPGLENVADLADDVPHLHRSDSVSVVPAAVVESVALLVSAASRLKADPTDMQADGDVAEASASVFVIDAYDPLDQEEWSAVGRVTRKLLTLLGAEEALEDDIRRQASILVKLLAPLALAAGGEGGVPAGPAGVRTVYELPEWLPEQRAQLGVLLDEAGISYGWEGDELLVPSEHEDRAEALFGQVDGIDDEGDDEDDEVRYAAVAELFAATGRLAGDPGDEVKQAAAVDWFEQSDGPPLLGMEDTDWYRIVARGKSLVAAVEADDLGRVASEADELHRLLRSVV